MTRPTLLITGATGNVGGALLPLLASHDAQLLAGSTRGEPVAGVPGRAIDFRSAEPLTQAFAGVDLAFVVIPLHPAMVEMAAHVAQAARAAGVKHLVRVSGAGADPDSPFAIGRVQGQVDQHLLASGIPTTLLRPKNFMQNFSSFLAGMVKAGTFYTSQGEGRIPFIDVCDIAAVAAEVLRNPSAHAGQAHVLTGPQALTNQEALDILGGVLGRTIQRVDIPEAAAVKSMREMGMPEMVVEVMSSLNQVIAAGYVAEVTDTVQRITGKPPRTFAAFAREHASVWA
jgi:uncharacterized protein YbjT (DUF2867 family)